MKKILLAGLILSFSIPIQVYAESRPIIVGPVYEIEERDIIDLIKKRAARFDTQAYLKKQYEKAFHPDSLDVHLTEKGNIRYIDPSSELSSDILDANGNILYPAGYKFNILDSIEMKPHLFIDGTDPEQIGLIEQLVERNNFLVVNLTAGDVMKTRKLTNVPVYFASQLMLQRFGVEKVPSFIVQEGNRLKVEEIKTNNRK